jgi:large subunit ribosomal protein L15
MRKKIFPGRKAQSPPHKKTVKKEEVKLKVKPARKVRLGPKAEIAQTFIGLHNLSAPKGAHKGKKLLGRGPGSGHGKTSTRGSKGQTSRAGRDFYLGFEGGQMPLIRRMPKRGFTSNSRKAYQVVNLEAISKIKEPQITLELLEQKGLIGDKNKLVKILGDGEIKNPVTVWAHAFSKSALLKIKSAGGKSELVNA